MKTVSGKARRGVQAFADALLVVPKTLAENSGFDVMDTIIKMQEAYENTKVPCGLDCDSGEVMSPTQEGVWDNFIVKRQGLHLSNVLATQLLLVDEVMRAGPKIK